MKSAAKASHAMNSNVKTVLATGVFDLFHEEHRRFLLKAKEAGGANGRLVVGVEPDVRVRALKGEGRPIQSQDVRVAQIRSLPFVDEVLLLPEDFGDATVREQFLQNLHPHILAVSSHTPFLDKKQQMMKKIGGEVVVVHQQNPNISTTKILEEKTATA